MSTSQTNFALLHDSPAAPTGFRNVFPQKGGTDPAYISNYYDNIGEIDNRTNATGQTIGISAQGNLVTFTNSSNGNWTLDSTVPDTFVCDLGNLGPSILTLTPSSGTIAVGNAAAASTGNVAAGQFGRLFKTGSTWRFASGGVGGASTSTIVVTAASSTGSVSAPASETVEKDTTGSSNITRTLAAASAWSGKVITFIKVDSGTGTCLIAPNSGDTINGDSTGYLLSNQYQYVKILSDGTSALCVIGNN